MFQQATPQGAIQLTER